MTAPAAPEGYPLMYFLCHPLTEHELLRIVLHLPKAPKIRKAKIIGYQRSSCNTESPVFLDGMTAAEERIKGVVYEVANEEEERLLHEYVGMDCKVGLVDIEVRGTWVGRSTIRGMAYFTETGESRYNGERQLTVKDTETNASPEAVAKLTADEGKHLEQTISAPAKTLEIDGDNSTRMASAILRSAPRDNLGHETTSHVTSTLTGTPTLTGTGKGVAIVEGPNGPGSMLDVAVGTASVHACVNGTEQKDLSTNVRMQVPPFRQSQSTTRPAHNHLEPRKFRSMTLPNGASVFDFAFPARRG